MAGSQKLDRSFFKSTDFATREAERKAYWLNKTPEERLNALEELRQQMYPDGKNPPRFQRVFRSFKRGEG